MNRSDIEELHYIAPIANVPSILDLGILSHNRVARLPHRTIAMEEVQDRRHAKRVPPGNRTVHDFANVYFHTRNPMMFVRKAQHEDICVLQVAPTVLDLPDAVITDKNAASGYARFYTAPNGIANLDHELVFARYWTHEDPLEQKRRKAARCAEVLVPDRIPPELITGAYVSGPPGRRELSRVAPRLAIEVDADLFFQGGS